MNCKYKEIRKIDAHSIINLCIKRNWFTCGTTEEYNTLLSYSYENKEITVDELFEMASLILEHSNTDYSITSIMYELSKICFSYFEEYC